MVQFEDISGIKYNDRNNIKSYERINVGCAFISNVDVLDIYFIKFIYKDNTEKYIRVLCDHDSSQKLNSREKEEFFINRLFGNNGLIVKNNRNDYIYLGTVNPKTAKYRIDRFKQRNEGITGYEQFENYYRNFICKIIDKKRPDYDLTKGAYYLHCGNAPKEIVFQNGLDSRYGLSLTSTFYPVSGEYALINNLSSLCKFYGMKVNKGENVFVARIPLLYRGQYNNGVLMPPMPIFKNIDVNSSKSTIIPEVIYCMYNNGIIYKNYNYNATFSPFGLSYDLELIRTFKNLEDGPTCRFMEQREDYSYDILLDYDKKNPEYFNELCRYYGIDLPTNYKQFK